MEKDSLADQLKFLSDQLSKVTQSSKEQIEQIQSTADQERAESQRELSTLQSSFSDTARELKQARADFEQLKKDHGTELTRQKLDAQPRSSGPWLIRHCVYNPSL